MELPQITLPGPELDKLEDEILTLCPGGHPNSPICGHLKIPHL